MSTPTKPPVAEKRPQRLELHGDVRVDDYFWLREKTDDAVMAHLKAENAYTAEVLAPTAELRQTLFQEMKGRIKEDDRDVPAREGDWFYYSRMETGKQYSVYCRKHLSLDAKEEIILDCNVLAEGKSYFRLGSWELTSDGNLLAYSADYDGSEHYTIYFRDLKTGKDLTDTIKDTAASVAWAEDGKTVFYNMLDKHDRPDRVYRHALGTDSNNDQLIYQETDSQFFVYLWKSRSRGYIFISAVGKVTSETRYLDAKTPLGEIKLVEPRKRGVLYSVTHHGGGKTDKFFIVTNDVEVNFRVVEVETKAPQAANWREVRRGSSTTHIQGIEAFKNHLITHERVNGLEQVRVTDLTTKTDHLIEFQEPAYSVSSGRNLEFNTDVFRFGYNSLVTPATVYDYNMNTRIRETMKVQEIPSGYDPKLYRSERIFATAADGAKIPISLVYRIDMEHRPQPVYLYAYGSYGHSIPPGFSSVRLSLLDRGFIYAIAHIRGGSDMGRQWYENGKFLTKKNTFSDFVACAEHLIKEGYAKKGEIAIAGRSAGGLLMGAVLNLAPQLFKVASAHVPFVDALNTMLDSTLPLTPIEYEEWGNPADPVYYEYIKSYSPYDNVKPAAFPHMLVTSGLNDPRVTYWEPAKWVAKLRELKTDNNLLVQVIHMGAGHGGPSGRYEALKEAALEYAFVLYVFGMMNVKSANGAKS